MIAAAASRSGDRRLEQLYEISKLFAAFDGVEHTLDAALKVIAGKLPLESAILIEAMISGRTEMIVWPSRGHDPDRLQSAKRHATEAYTYLVGASSQSAVDLWDRPREDLGPTQLPTPARGDDAASDARRFIVIPLVVGHGAVFGALQLEGAAHLDRSDLEFVNAIANQLAIALDRSRAWGQDVVLRREAQRLQAKYETLVDHLDYAFVWEADARTRQLSYVSAQLERMLGFARQRCLDEPSWWDTHVHPEDRAQLRQTFDRAIAEQGNKRCEHRCFAADGSLRWLRTSIHLVGDGGEPPHLQGVSFDITAARSAQDEVREQLAFTSAMASSLAEGTLAIDLDDRITFINAAAAGLLGCSDREMVGSRCMELLRIETFDSLTVESPLAAAIRTGRVRNDAHTIVRTDGVRFPASYTATPIRRDGRVTGAVLAFDDISERKQSQSAAVFLLQARAILSASLESAAVANAVARLCVPVLGDICFVDMVSVDDQVAQLAWAHIDPITERELGPLVGVGPRPPMLATSVTEVVALGRSRWMAIVPDSAYAVADQAIARRLAIRSALLVPLTLGPRTLGCLTIAMTGDRQLREGDIALSEELGRRCALAIDHARLYEQARRAVALREQTLAIVSHELRSPLATIVIASSILQGQDGTSMSPRARVVTAEKIQTAAEHMERMIGDLMDFASIEAGRLSITVKPHDVTAIIDESMASFEALASRRLVKLTGEIDRGLPAIDCDRDRILQVIANLVGNALKSARSGDSVTLRAQLGDRAVVFSVADTGPGIAAAEQRRLFERYWRSPDASYKGTGLGLAIARGLVDAHRGRLWVDSELGHGATFSFTVPLA